MPRIVFHAIGCYWGTSISEQNQHVDVFYVLMKGNYLSPNIPEATISWPDDDDDDNDDDGDDDDDDDDDDFALIPQVFDRTRLGTVLSTYDHLLKLRGIPARKLIF